MTVLRARAIAPHSTRSRTRTMSIGFCVSPFQFGVHDNEVVARPVDHDDYRHHADSTSTLVNMKYTIDWCLFQYQFNNATTQSRQCGQTCAGPEGAMRIAMTDRVLQTNATIQYQYCEGEDGAFERNVDDCVSCLEGVPSSMALANCRFPYSQLAYHSTFYLFRALQKDRI